MRPAISYPSNCVLPPKPKRYRLTNAEGLHQSLGRVARARESVSLWREAAAYWRGVSTIDYRAALAIATSSEMGDAWRAWRDEDRESRVLDHRAFGFRWLLFNDCLHEHFAFATEPDPVADTALMQVVTEGMDLSHHESEVLDALMEEAGSLRAVEGHDRDRLVARVVRRLGLPFFTHEGAVFAASQFDAHNLVAPWFDLVVGLGHVPGEEGGGREVVTLDAKAALDSVFGVV